MPTPGWGLRRHSPSKSLFSQVCFPDELVYIYVPSRAEHFILSGRKHPGGPARVPCSESASPFARTAAVRRLEAAGVVDRFQLKDGRLSARFAIVPGKERVYAECSLQSTRGIGNAHARSHPVLSLRSVVGTFEIGICRCRGADVAAPGSGTEDLPVRALGAWRRRKHKFKFWWRPCSSSFPDFAKPPHAKRIPSTKARAWVRILISRT